VSANVRTRRVAALVLALAAVPLSACGSSAESKKDFIARANAICNNTLRDTRNVPAPSSTGTVTLPALARYLRAVAPIGESEVRQLKALPKPSGDLALLHRYPAAQGATAAHYRAFADAAKSGDTAAMTAAIAALNASPAERLARAYGLTACTGPTRTTPPATGVAPTS
jgi:hypothetical protein